MKLRNNAESPAIVVGNLITLLKQIQSDQIITVLPDRDLAILSADQTLVLGKILISDETREDWNPPRPVREVI